MNKEALEYLVGMIARDIVGGFYEGKTEKDIRYHMLGEIEALENIYGPTRKKSIPGNMEKCEDCPLTMRQCEMRTSANGCKIWNDYEKNGK